MHALGIACELILVGNLQHFVWQQEEISQQRNYSQAIFLTWWFCRRKIFVCRYLVVANAVRINIETLDLVLTFPGDIS